MFSYVPTFFATSGKKVLDPNGPYIAVSDYSKKCLFVGNFGILSVVICLSVARLQPTPAYLEV